MVTDSPYGFRDLVLGPTGGTVGGLAAALIMLGLLRVLGVLSSHAGLAAFQRLGAPWCQECPPMTLLAAGLGTYGLVGAGLGVLYAACQQQAPPRGLIATGLFYGLILWVVGRVIVASVVGGDLAAMLGGWQWLFGLLVYGTCLSLAAWTAEGRRLRSGASTVVQPD